jgi:TolA-binding protein
MGKFESATEVYKEFLNKYPQDSLAKDVRFLLENIGKTPDQMFKEMEMAK